MAANLTGQVRNIADVTMAVAKGDLSKDHGGRKGEILSQRRSTRWWTARRVQLEVSRWRARWAVGSSAARRRCPTSATGRTLPTTRTPQANLTNQVRNIADVTTAVAKGDSGRSR
jgi:HAMP domain-containing protein